MEVVDYDYIEALSILDVQPESASNWTANNVPWINSPKINATSSVYNIPQQDIEQDVAWWSTSIQWSSTWYRNATYSWWTLYLPDWTSYNISWATVTLSSSNPYYFYYDTINQQVAYTTVTQDSVWAWKILLAVAKRNTNTDWRAIIQPFGTWATDTFITADNIAANTITWNELAANSIDGMTITWATIRTASSWQRFMMTSSYVRYYDYNWYKRVEFTWDWLNFYNSSWSQACSLYGTWYWIYVDWVLWVYEDMAVWWDLSCGWQVTSHNRAVLEVVSTWTTAPTADWYVRVSVNWTEYRLLCRR